MSEIERVASVEVVSPDEIEARAAVEQIRNGLSDLFEGLARFVNVNGWKLLGYPSFRQWASEELSLSLRNADLHYRKTKRLIEMSSVMGRTIAELAPTVSLRSGHRRPVNPVVAQMRAASNKLASVPALTNPDERNAARTLRDHLTRLLED